jgi:hypothetical protein
MVIAVFQQLDLRVADARLELAQRLAVAGLAVFMVYHIDEVSRASGAGGFLPIANPMTRELLFGLPTLALSAAAFALSWKRPSIIVPIMLIVTGASMVWDGITIGTRYLTILVLPGPVIGLIYGVIVLALGVAKGIMTGVAMKATATTAR